MDPFHLEYHLLKKLHENSDDSGFEFINQQLVNGTPVIIKNPSNGGTIKFNDVKAFTWWRKKEFPERKE